MWELGHKEGWTLKNWCFRTVVLQKTLGSPLDSKEIKPVNPKGNQPWIFIGRNDDEAEAPTVWPPDVKIQLVGKNPDAGKDWGQENKGATEDEVVRKYHWVNGHEWIWASSRRQQRTGKPSRLQSTRHRVRHDFAADHHHLVQTHTLRSGRVRIQLWKFWLHSPFS